MKSIWRIVSSLVALSLVILVAVWVRPEEEISVMGARTAVRSTGGAALRGDTGSPAAAQTLVYASERSVPTISPAVRDLPPLGADYPLLDREMAQKDDFGFAGPDVQGPPWQDPLVALQSSTPVRAIDAFTTPLTNWPGLDYNSLPPDTTGDVGPNHFVQAVNGGGGSVVQVFNKSGTVLKTFTMESLSSSAPCNNGYCDPIVIYDSLADRWFISEFSAASSYPMCLYVSTSPDPTGTWYAYTFDLPYYDYPKYGLWPDAYYMGYNGGAAGTRQVFAFDRAKMLAGQPATYQMFTLPTLSGFGFQLVVPASLEGPAAPPAGAPGLFMRPRDTEVHGPAGYDTSDLMEMWAFHVDWTTPANSTLTKLTDVPMAEYDCTMCGTGNTWDCMPQPGTTQKLDPIREPLHQPLQYRNWGTYETLVGGFVQDVDGTDHAAVRWFEMRKTAGAWSVYQQGTVGGDAHHRSVTSVALDGAGGLAMGYTLTSSSIYPSIRYAGRRPWDTLNTMAFVDAVGQNGDSSQASYDRWGDYAGIGVDPADDCTFWYTTEYMSGGSSATRVMSLRLDPDFYPDASPNSVDICGTGDSVVYTVDVARTCALSGAVTMSAAGLPAGATASWSANPVTPPGSSALTIGDLGSVPAGTYNIDVIGTAAGPIIRQETVVLNVQTTAPAAAALSAPANGTTSVATAPSLTWDALSGATTYDVRIATDPGMSNVVRSATGLAATSYTPSPTLEPDTVYYWQVRGNNGCGGGGYSPTWAFRTVASSCRTYTSSDVPKTISDRTTVDSTLAVADSFNATDVNVTIDQILHTYDADLDISIVHPDGTVLALSTDNGGSGDNYANTTLDDEAATAITAGTAPFTGSFQPEVSLASLDGKAANGTWRLRIYDDRNGDTGSLQSWSLVICGAPALPADYGDLEGSYGVAWHTGNGALRLGAAWDADTTFAPMDDNSSDDGVSFPNGFQTGPCTVRVNVQGTPANGRWLRVWFDWNRDGMLGDQVDGERAYDGPAVNGNNDISVNVPAGLSQVNYRVRLYDAASLPRAMDAGSYGGTTGGEVEDNLTPLPTAVDLARFEAWPAGGIIQVEWETFTEINRSGFNLYRRDTRAGGSVRLNEELILAQASGSPGGATYAWLDASVEPGVTYSYELEAVYRDGSGTLHGPVEVSAVHVVYLPLAIK